MQRSPPPDLAAHDEELRAERAQAAVEVAQGLEQEAIAVGADACGVGEERVEDEQRIQLAAAPAREGGRFKERGIVVQAEALEYRTCVSVRCACVCTEREMRRRRPETETDETGQDTQTAVVQRLATRAQRVRMHAERHLAEPMDSTASGCGARSAHGRDAFCLVFSFLSLLSPLFFFVSPPPSPLLSRRVCARVPQLARRGRGRQCFTHSHDRAEAAPTRRSHGYPKAITLQIQAEGRDGGAAVAAAVLAVKRGRALPRTPLHPWRSATSTQRSCRPLRPRRWQRRLLRPAPPPPPRTQARTCPATRSCPPRGPRRRAPPPAPLTPPLPLPPTRSPPRRRRTARVAGVAVAGAVGACMSLWRPRRGQLIGACRLRANSPLPRLSPLMRLRQWACSRSCTRRHRSNNSRRTDRSRLREPRSPLVRPCQRRRLRPHQIVWRGCSSRRKRSCAASASCVWSRWRRSCRWARAALARRDGGQCV